MLHRYLEPRAELHNERPRARHRNFVRLGARRRRRGANVRLGAVPTKGASQLAICGRALEWAIDTLRDPLPDVVAIEGLRRQARSRRARTNTMNCSRTCTA